ncbi:MAG TPA: hypothetical protein VIG25_06235 [Pyrinomonadaceae bacterium]
MEVFRSACDLITGVTDELYLCLSAFICEAFKSPILIWFLPPTLMARENAMKVIMSDGWE